MPAWAEKGLTLYTVAVSMCRMPEANARCTMTFRLIPRALKVPRPIAGSST